MKESEHMPGQSASASLGEPTSAKSRVREAAKSEDAQSVPHVFTAINKITAEFADEGISKGRENKQQGFAFRGIDDVLNALSKKLADHKLLILPSYKKREVSERTTAKGGVLFDVVVEADFEFISAIDGSSHRVGPFCGEAMDSGDKATNKAMSAAYKYMALQTFCIPTEGDNDADATSHDEVMVVRPNALPFIDAATKLIRGSGTLANAEDAYKEVLEKPGYKTLNAPERGEIEKVILFMRRMLADD